MRAVLSTASSEVKPASISSSKRSSSRASDEGEHIFLLGGSEALSPLLPLRSCEGCFMNVNDFNFTSELGEGEGESVLVGWETTFDGWTTSVFWWTTSLCFLFVLGLLSLSGAALLLEAVGNDEFPDDFGGDVRALLGPVSQLACSPSVNEENKMSASLKKSYQRIG